MLKVDFSKEFTQQIASEVVQQLVPILMQELEQEKLPPLLSRKEFMELSGVGESKCAELFHRSDFPVNRELGRPRVVTKDFFEWLHATNQNAGEIKVKYPYEVV